MRKTDVSKTADHDEKRCPKCDYCPHCGRSRMDAVPVYPYPYPYTPPWQPYVRPWYPYTISSGSTYQMFGSYGTATVTNIS